MELLVQKRNVFGKKVKRLRKEWIVPAIIYGKKLQESIAIQMKKIEFVKLYKKAGETQTIILKGDDINQMVLVHDIDLHPVTDEVIHVDFLAVSTDEKVEAEVNVVLIGESPVEKNKIWKLELLKDTILVEAYPQDLPEKIEIDVSGIEKVSDVIHVSDVKVPEKIEIKDNPTDTIVTVLSLEELSSEEKEESEAEETETTTTTTTEETSTNE